MLVLTRKPDQSIVIGSEIEITVLEVRGEQVRLGIRAPRSVAVHRKEVFDQIQGAAEHSMEHDHPISMDPVVDIVLNSAHAELVES